MRLCQTSLHSSGASSVKQALNYWTNREVLEKIYKKKTKKLFLTSAVHFWNFATRIYPRFFTKLWECYFLEQLILANSQCSSLNLIKNVKYSLALYGIYNILVYFFLIQNSLSCVKIGLIIQYLKRQHWGQDNIKFSSPTVYGCQEALI